MKRIDRGYLDDLFTSIQGEGLWAGSLHHFLRLSGCGAGCRYCDSPSAQHRVDRFRFGGKAGGRNPATVSTVVGLLTELDRERPRAQALAVTGGEPLEQPGFLSALLPLARDKMLKGRPVLLETGGLHPEAMEALSEAVDMVSMDWKLPSSSGIQGAFPVHRRFLEALSGTPFYVKAVVNAETSVEEIAEAASLVAAADPGAPFFIQPETRDGSPAGGAYLITLWEAARDKIRDVRILPQIHPVLSLR